MAGGLRRERATGADFRPLRWAISLQWVVGDQHVRAQVEVEMQAAYHRHREQPPSVQDFADAPAGTEDRFQVAARESALGFVGLNERRQNAQAVEILRALMCVEEAVDLR